VGETVVLGYLSVLRSSEHWRGTHDGIFWCRVGKLRGAGERRVFVTVSPPRRCRPAPIIFPELCEIKIAAVAGIVPSDYVFEYDPRMAELKPGTFNVYHLDPENDPEAEWRNLAKMKQPLKAGTPLKNRITATNMPKVKKRDTTGHEARINAAIRALKEGQQESMGAAAEAFDILKSTLYYRYTGERTSCHLAQVDNQLISDQEEKAIVA